MRLAALAAAVLPAAFALAACSSVPRPATPGADAGPTPAGSVDVVLDRLFTGQSVLVTLDGQTLRSGPLAQTTAPAWRARRAVSPDSHVVYIQVDAGGGRVFRSTRRILPATTRCVFAQYDDAAAFPNNLRVETRPAC